jgi:hypothetical protein
VDADFDRLLSFDGIRRGDLSADGWNGDDAGVGVNEYVLPGNSAAVVWQTQVVEAYAG